MRLTLIERQKDVVGFKSRASLSPEQLRMQDYKESLANLNFGTDLTQPSQRSKLVLQMPLSNRSKQSVGSDINSSEEKLMTEQNDLETDLLSFCERELERTNNLLNRTYKDGKEIRNIDATRKELKMLMPAKLALSLLIRAIKKRDYMILQGDAIPEVDQIKPVALGITKYADDLRNLRAQQKRIFKRQFSKDSFEDRSLLALPKLQSSSRHYEFS